MRKPESSLSIVFLATNLLIAFLFCSPFLS